MSVKQSEWVSHSIRATAAVVLGSVAMMAAAPRVSAADDAGPPSLPTANAGPPAILEEVTVTGTRIRRRDLESSSPLVSIDSTQLENRAGVNIESYLNLLPNYNPAQTPTTDNFDVQPSAVNTVGISTISLRGFGPNRSLVLIDGHRTTPVNALMVTDVNSIPAALIDRVEIITGGASAVYGADAIGGVTNFIMKKNFQGAQIDVQDSETQAGDGNEAMVPGGSPGNLCVLRRQSDPEQPELEPELHRAGHQRRAAPGAVAAGPGAELPRRDTRRCTAGRAVWWREESPLGSSSPVLPRDLSHPVHNGCDQQLAVVVPAPGRRPPALER
jgi:TonB-dependent Receptor Plug Domain